MNSASIRMICALKQNLLSNTLITTADNLEMYLVTNGASAGQRIHGIIDNQDNSASNCQVISDFIEAIPGLLVVLNEEGQIIRLNGAFASAFGVNDLAKVLGLRLCEVINCVHAAVQLRGCEATQHCATCVVAFAITAAVKNDQVSQKVCALTVNKSGETFERFLAIRVQPLRIDSSRWILVFAQDITDQHTVSTLEHIFYHDINNILTALVGNIDILAIAMPDQHRVRQILNAAKRLCSEITLQQFLNKQKDGANLLRKSLVSIRKINEEVELIMYGHPKSHNRNVEQIWPDEEIKLHTEIHLISRVLSNMLLNALEATVEGGMVRFISTVHETDAMWEVWNESYIPPEIQPRIFQKHFSTKESIGRGVGTYSMKLFGEKYLNGKVSFISSTEGGTSFYFIHPLNQV